MSFNISLTFADSIFQITDRRASRIEQGTNRLIRTDDFFNKSVFVAVPGGAFSVSFCGWATLPSGQNIDDWVLSIIAKNQNIAGIGETIQNLRLAADQDIGRFHYKHAFILCGWVNNELSEPDPFVCLISNYHKPADATNHFQQQSLTTKFSCLPLMGGNNSVATGLNNAFDSTRMTQLKLLSRRYRKGKISPANLVDGAVSLIRGLADDPRSEGMIGKFCMSVYWRKGHKAIYEYHPVDLRDKTGFAPNAFLYGGTIRGAVTRGLRRQSIFGIENEKDINLNDYRSI